MEQIMEVDILKFCGAMIATITAYHAMIIKPQRDRNKILDERIRTLEYKQAMVTTEIKKLSELPHAIESLKESIHELKIELARRGANERTNITGN